MSRRRIANHGALLVALTAITLAAFVRLRYLDVPLERDEGEYAYAGQLILAGVPPYLHVYNMKFPGTYYAYASIMALFGETARGIHLGLLVVNVATALVVFAIARRLVDDLCAAVAASTFVIMSLDRWILGVFAHATHFVLLPALAGLLLLLATLEARRLWPSLASGALLGAALLMKQHAIFFVALGVVLIAWYSTRGIAGNAKRGAAQAALLCLGAALPLGIVAALLHHQGVFDAFWFWTVRYASQYVSEIPVSEAWHYFAREFTAVTRSTWVFWLVAAAGVVALTLGRWTAMTRWFVGGLLAASFLAVCPGFYFRPHYFILLLPAVALLVGIATATLRRLLARRLSPAASVAVTATLFAAAVAPFVIRERSYLLWMTPRELSRTRFGNNPFIEAIEVARYIRDHTDEADRVVVFGSEPEIYFYADRRAASGYIYTYALMEPQPYASRMQDEMIGEVDAAHPKYLVFVDAMTSWIIGPQSRGRIIDWVRRYIHECYELVGVADIVSDDTTRFLWDDRVRDGRPGAQNFVYTFRAKSPAPCSVAR